MNDRPWMTALEMQFAALRTLRTFRSRQTDLPWHRLTTACLLRAECFSFTRDTTAAVQFAARSVPREAVFHTSDLPAPAGFWWFNHPIKPTVGPDNDLVSGILYGPDNGSTGFWALCQNRAAHATDDPIPSFDFSIQDGESLNQLDHRQVEREAVLDQPGRHVTVTQLASLVLASCAWLKQRVAIFSSGHVERHRRKQLEREHNTPIASDVKVIQLRRSESPYQPQAATCGDAPEWSCRWIVNGHWRDQPYKDEKKLIYIMPFVKGPADKPLKVPTHTVYQVSR